MTNEFKVCAVCKHANHDPSLGERKEVICILNPNKPTLKQSDDICLQYVSKYKKIKIIQDTGMLFEYDPSTESSKEVSSEDFEKEYIEEPIIESKEEETEIPWQL